MGPAFSLLLVTLVAATLAVLVFCILLFRYSAPVALGLAVAFVGGVAIGVCLAVFAALVVLGSGTTLESRLAIVLYLAWMASGGLAGGLATACFAGRLVIHLRKKMAATPPLS